MILNLVPTERSITRYTHVKYEGPKAYQSKDMANVKVFAEKKTDKCTERQMDGPKPICPRSVVAGA